jgi:hypothetical protein
MKLQEINKILKEEENDKEKLTQLFSDADEADNLKVYVRQDAFQIRPAKVGEEIHVNFPGEPGKVSNAEEEQYVVRMSEHVNKIKLIDKEEFEEKYEIINPNDKPDAEGFQDYRLKDEIIAFQYVENEPLKFNISGHTIHINPEDYIAHPLSDAKKLIVKSKVDFEKKYRLS